MGPVAMTLTSGLHEVADALNTTDFSGGPRSLIGQCVPLAASEADTTICYLATGTHPTLSAGDVAYGPHADPKTVNAAIAAGTIEALTLPANSGGQVWMYCRASGALGRGEALQVDVSDFATLGTTLEVAAAGSGSNVVKAVAQWNIPDDDYGWVLVSGVGYVLSNGAFSIGDALTVIGSAGEHDTVAGTEVSHAVALAAATGGSEMVLADICCPG